MQTTNIVGHSKWAMAVEPALLTVMVMETPGKTVTNAIIRPN